MSERELLNKVKELCNSYKEKFNTREGEDFKKEYSAYYILLEKHRKELPPGEIYNKISNMLGYSVNNPEQLAIFIKNIDQLIEMCSDKINNIDKVREKNQKQRW